MQDHPNDTRVRVKQSINGVSLEVEGGYADVCRYLSQTEGATAAAQFEVIGKAEDERVDIGAANAPMVQEYGRARRLLSKDIPLADQLSGHSMDWRSSDIAFYPWYEKFVLYTTWGSPWAAFDSYQEAKEAKGIRDGKPLDPNAVPEAGAWADKPAPMAPPPQRSNLQSWTAPEDALEFPPIVDTLVAPKAPELDMTTQKTDKLPAPWDLPPAPATPEPWATENQHEMPRVEMVDEMRTVVMYDYDARPVRMEDAGLFTGLLALTGDDPKRGGLIETPDRMLKAFEHWFGGYKIDIAELLKVFEDGAEGVDQMVIVKDIPIYSKCEHHMADIFGTATIAYIPNGKIVGLSKLSRLADAFARRLQVQERLTNQIADALTTHLQPLGVGVVIKARHMCMESRGICQQGHHTITSALRGVIKEQASARAEFFSMVNSN